MSVSMSPEAPMWVPPAALPATSPATTSPWWGQQHNTTSKPRPAANTYESNGTVFFVQKDGPGGVKSKISEREAVTPSGQRIFILPRAVNAEFHVGMEDQQSAPQCKQ
mmetsp:Transcript_11406/g.23862  ORF Transcript_11406/g.23862 Transcript_11406/m.23862 type:complete len:108 (-) Transcript_11406:369-692(-)|eukprot:CAMPEP_0119541194 /NCGR_PEP_ID=MMETSP1344-20130328/52806_1 /TAXON_ID=236787 /ORGANISM="Florenciella parvula, Strain CCMP2471" /LENGTH=107 /DNA_ID=CAMNT_0007585131 /DNA_START=123 /DNA_END=446 /DNA_ORIENTATION=+